MFRSLRLLVATLLFSWGVASAEGAPTVFNWFIAGLVSGIPDSDLPRLLPKYGPNITISGEYGPVYIDYPGGKLPVYFDVRGMSMWWNNLLITGRYPNDGMTQYYDYNAMLSRIIPMNVAYQPYGGQHHDFAFCYEASNTHRKINFFAQQYAPGYARSFGANYVDKNGNYSGEIGYWSETDGRDPDAGFSTVTPLCLRYQFPIEYAKGDVLGLLHPMEDEFAAGIRGVAVAYLQDVTNGLSIPEWVRVDGPIPAGFDQPCTGSTCEGYTPPGGSTGGTDPGGSTGGTGGTGGAPTTCTTSSGTTTTNQYQCAPSDTDSKCTVLDIPCNFRYLFIPDKKAVQELFNAETISKTLNLPIQVVNESRMTFCVGNDWTLCTGEGDNQSGNRWVSLDWRTIKIPTSIIQLISFVIWLGVASYILGYLGLPNPFRRVVSGTLPDQPQTAGIEFQGSYKTEGYRGDGFGGRVKR